MESLNLDANIRSDLEAHKPNERYASFDYCFNYFQSFREREEVSALASPDNIQLSCLQLGFYLASWGMLRGSADLLQKSARHLFNVIKVIGNTDRSVWELDAHCYTSSDIGRLVDLAETISQCQPIMSDILVTKIMLGVFGNVPAFDTNFKQGCKAAGIVATFGPRALREIGAFYQDNAAVIDAHRVSTFHFVSGERTGRRYTRAKVIDMAFFIEGMPERQPHN